MCTLSSETLVKLSDPNPATLSCPSSSRTMFLQPYQSIIAYSIHVATYLKVLNEFNNEIMLNELTLVTNVREWLAQACTHGDNSVPWTRREKILNTLFGSTVADTSFIVLFQLYPTESTQNCYLKTHLCVTTPKRTVLPFWSISQERIYSFSMWV